MPDLSYLAAAVGAALDDRTDMTVRIPTDYATLQAAIDDLKNAPVQQGNRILLLIESGHALTHGLKLLDGDYSSFVIGSEDAIVELAPSFVAIPNDTRYGEAMDERDGALIFMLNARGLNVETVVDMGFRSDADVGVFVGTNSSINFTPSSGIKNSYYNNLFSVNSRIWCDQGIFTNAGAEGIRARVGSTIMASTANFDDCCSHETPADASIFLSRTSTGYFNGATARNSGAMGVAVHRSVGSFEGVNCDNAKTFGLQVDTGSVVNAAGITLTNAQGRALQAQRSYVSIRNGHLENSANKPIQISFGAIVDANGVGVDDISDYIETGTPNQINGSGIVFNAANPSPLDGNYGTFSNTGASNGKEFGTASILLSSRDSATTAQSHYGFYNANGQVGSITTAGARTRYHVTASAAVVITGGSGSPEGAIVASPGSLYTRTDGGAGTTLYVKESGTGNTGWVAK
ncbi:hypothetical protein [Ancylobacter oerskovii]|uniref:Uncharacterized protein n=1 Tax=Ancylobacter oerskovii TaxID=459519 RepID=A0ABW4Z148_9HYPH|nr:hypothetical protein [Ancylobacter oerskovii]MBS7542547.1 hypothetical protein [Ancylobacter oerskovii]